jgi:cytochrome c-type biogenesis protein CcmH/NrfF
MNRHPLDPVSLVFGLAFAAIGLATLVLAEVPLAWLDPRIVLPLVALLAGAWLLVSATRRREATAAGDDDTATTELDSHD